MPDIFITPAEIATRLDLTEATVRRYINAGIIPAKRLDHRVLIHRADFERWLVEGNTEDASKPESRSVLDLWLDGEIELVIQPRRVASGPQRIRAI